MRVLHVQYTNPGAYPPLVRGAELLADTGAQVLMVGARVEGLDALDIPERNNIRVRLMPAAEQGWRLKAHYARYAAWVAREGAAFQPDWIYASDVLSAPVALALRALTGARVVYHEHDAPTHEHPSWTLRQCLAARLRLIREAAIVVTPNAERSASLARLGGGRTVITAWNAPLRPIARPVRAEAAEELRVIYRGSINVERLPVAVIDAIADPRVTTSLVIAGYETLGSRGHIAALEARARELGVAGRVTTLGTVSESVLTNVAATCDVGLALMPMTSHDENMRHMTGASNKVFEYLNSGITPLVSDLPEWRATFADPGYALTCDPRSAASIADAFAWAGGHRDDLRRMADRGWERLARDWNYETQFAPVLALMTGAALGTTAMISAVEAEARCAS